ncbi:MAG: outer membrane protein assembly factor BamC [Cocleimonas sp.]|nr:outer membrane protein assembly factor BamC [Cocleimonas sp.]
MKNGMVVCSVVCVLSGCSTFDELADTDHGVYTMKEPIITLLDFPPDVMLPISEADFTLPTVDKVRAAVMANQSTGNSLSRSTIDVLPTSKHIQINHRGALQWLTVDFPARSLWPKMHAFWHSLDIKVLKDEPEFGFMETEWVESSAGLPLDQFRQTVGVAQSSLDAGTRNRYRLRVERPSSGKTNIYITHKGSEKVVVQVGEAWELRPPKHELEAEMLSRLKAFLESNPYKTIKSKYDDKEWDSTHLSRLRVELSEDEDKHPQLHLYDDYQTVWVHLGIKLEQMGMEIEAYQEVEGIYHLVYVKDDRVEKGNDGFFTRLFKRYLPYLSKGVLYQAHLEDKGTFVVVEIKDEDGLILENSQSQQILHHLKRIFED